MTSLQAYGLLTISFIISFSLTLISLTSITWVTFESARPNRSVTNYGLYKKCSNFLTNGCRDFPDEEYGDCDEDGFCEEWMAARTDIVLATILDGIIFLLLLTFFVGGSSLRKDHWKLITGLIILDFVALVFHAYKNSEKFIYGFRLDTSFYLASFAAVLNLTNGIGFIVYSVLFQPQEQSNDDDGYEPINQLDEENIESDRPVPVDLENNNENIGD